MLMSITHRGTGVGLSGGNTSLTSYTPCVGFVLEQFIILEKTHKTCESSFLLLLLFCEAALPAFDWPSKSLQGILVHLLLISAKSVYWHYKTQVVQYNSTLCMRGLSPAPDCWCADELLAAGLVWSRSPCVPVTSFISSVDLHVSCCKSWIQFCFGVNGLDEGQGPPRPLWLTGTHNFNKMSHVINHSVGKSAFWAGKRT